MRGWDNLNRHVRRGGWRMGERLCRCRKCGNGMEWNGDVDIYHEGEENCLGEDVVDAESWCGEER